MSKVNKSFIGDCIPLPDYATDLFVSMREAEVLIRDQTVRARVTIYFLLRCAVYIYEGKR